MFFESGDAERFLVYAQIGRFCRDVNECIQRPCDDNQYCVNTRGSYRCHCRRGYHDDRRGKCVDTDECAQKMCQGKDSLVAS